MVESWRLYVLLERVKPDSDLHRVEVHEVERWRLELERQESRRVNLKQRMVVLSALRQGKVEHLDGDDGLHAANSDLVPELVQRLQLNLL